MSIIAAFLDPSNDDLFTTVASFANARELELLDVADQQKSAREAIRAAVANALRQQPSPGSRIALVKGGAGSGKSHILTTTFRRVSSSGEVYAAVLQLTAPVNVQEYDQWLLDATFRELSARHFSNERNQSPLRRMAGRLLDFIELAEQEEFMRAIDDLDSNEEIKLAYRFGRQIYKEAEARLARAPSHGFIAAVLLAGFGDASALNYLRYGVIDDRIRALGLIQPTTAGNRIEIIMMLGLTAQIVHACLALGFDQVENTVRLGSEGLFVHTLTQAVRLVEQIPNCAVIIAVLSDEYEDIVSGSRGGAGLTTADRDRIEHEAPFSVTLEFGTPEFRRAVVAQRLSVLRERAKLPPSQASLDPLPFWLLPRIDMPRNIRLALRAVALFRADAMQRGHLPSQEQFVGPAPPPAPSEVIDFAKEWADFRDSGGTTIVRLLDSKKAQLLAWWAEEASREHLTAEPAGVTLKTLDDVHKTSIIEVVLRREGEVVERRALALCEAPNRNQQLAEQVNRFLEVSDGCTPVILRTNGFPKGRTAQVAPALRKLEMLSGLRLDLGNTEWNDLARAKEFFDQELNAPGLSQWRRDTQWLQQLLSPLLPLIAFATVIDPQRAPSCRNAADQGAPKRQNGSTFSEGVLEDVTAVSLGPFPVLIGTSSDGHAVHWAPFRDAPDQLNNFSVLITGDAGSGKTQTIRVLIDAACRANLAVTIFDFKADYCEAEFAGPLGIDVVDVRAAGLPFNPLQPPPGGASGAQPIEHAYEIASILRRVFGLGAVQEGRLRDAICAAYQERGIAPREWVEPATKSWPIFSRVLDILKDDGGAAPLITRLSVLSDLGLFGAGGPSASAEGFFKRRVCLKLSDLPADEVKTALAEILIVQLHGHVLRGEQPRRLTRMLVFDEAHRVKDSKRLEQLAREGRAFGVGIVMGTQFPGDIPETMAGNLATQLFLMNNQAAHRLHVVKQMLGTSATSEGKAMLDKLGHLRPLEGLFANSHHYGVFLEVLPYYKRGQG